MKAYTDLQQSKKLEEILPFETADMHYSTCTIVEDGEFIVSQNQGSTIENLQEDYGTQIIPCWNLAALLDVLPYPQLSKDKLGSGKTGWMVSVYPNDCRYDSCWHDNPVDACYEMIIKLKEINLI